ncbi:MAG: ABC transporter permease [Minwuia sp.]|uniref:ABC transporter permease n=1 Tax=Minwuia sp. TaxID=2493630 RepID=UPI003A8AD1DF
MIVLERRRAPSRAVIWLTPVASVLLTVLAGMVLFAALGVDPVRAVGIIFLSPFADAFSVSELMVKATPLILIGTGLALGFRAEVWNIGAEGQFILGAIASSAVALAFYDQPGFWLLPLMCLAGIGGGMAWAAIPAALKTRFGASEILVSLMLVYVASLLLSALVTGPLRDPDGFNFPESRIFHDSALLPKLFEDGRAHVGFPIALIAAAIGWVLLGRHVIGFQIRLLGQSPRAARFAGFGENRIVWFCLLASGGLAGLAGAFEVAGPVEQLVPSLPAGYGFTAIIVAFLGRLNPIGIVLAGIVIAVTYIGGEAAQIEMQVSAAVTSVFQGLLLFFLLGMDLLAVYRIRLKPRAEASA